MFLLKNIPGYKYEYQYVLLSNEARARAPYRRKINSPSKINEKSFVLDRNLLADTKFFHACIFMRERKRGRDIGEHARPTRRNKRYSARDRRKERARARCIVARMERWCFKMHSPPPPITIRLSRINFISLRVFLLGRGGVRGRGRIASAIRKSEHDSPCGRRTLMPETAPLWSTALYSNHLADQLRKPPRYLRYLRSARASRLTCAMQFDVENRTFSFFFF